MSEFELVWDFPLRRRRIAGVGRVHPPPAVLRHPRQAHQRPVGGRRRRERRGTFPRSSAASACASRAASSSRCAITSCCSIRAPRRSSNLTDPVDEPATNRFNDGKVGPDGCFWVGSMDERTPREKTGVLYRVTPDGRIERKAEGYAVSNGLAWSPDGGHMYHSDSTAGIIEAGTSTSDTGGSEQPSRARDTDQRGRPSRRRRVDVEGNYWSAGPSAGCINRFSPPGKLLSKAAVPGARPDHAVLRRTPPLRDVAARGPLGRDAAAQSHHRRAVPHRCTGPRRTGRGVRRCLTRERPALLSVSAGRRRIARRRLVIAGGRRRRRVVRGRRRPRRGRRTADRADRAADQRARRRAASTTRPGRRSPRRRRRPAARRRRRAGPDRRGRCRPTTQGSCRVRRPWVR